MFKKALFLIFALVIFTAAVPVVCGANGIYGFRLERIELPLDNEGRADERVEANTIVLHDYTWDYFKNILNGKGALNKAVQHAHPLTYMGCDFFNPAKEHANIIITAELYDKTGKNKIRAFKMPTVNSLEHDGPDFVSHDDALLLLAALSGDERQRILMPIYVEPDFSAGGEYLIKVRVYSAQDSKLLAEHQTTIKLVKNNYWAGFMTGAALLTVAVGIGCFIKNQRKLFDGMKTRWLVTISLFGAVSFAAVSVPGTFLLDFARIVMGPFSFLVTGLFYGVMLYVLILSLVELIPRPGVVTLFTAVRMLLNMMVFGHMSPIMILFQGTHMALLELGMFVICATNPNHTGSKPSPLFIALVCGLAEAAASYINLQGSIFLYRLYYASWYIALYTLINGVVYTMIGAMLGIRLGRELKKVGGD